MILELGYDQDMRRRLLAVFVLAAAIVLSTQLWAQGPPASVTSSGFGGHPGRTTGPAASVTSPGFGNNGVHSPFFHQPGCCINPLFPSTGNVRHHHRFPNREFGPAVYAVPYYVPYDYSVDDTMEQPQALPANQYLGGPTIFDRRGDGNVTVPVAKPEVLPPAEPAPQAEPPEVADRPDTVLIFKDGHQVEVKNYAIVGETLYDMTPGHPRRVLLADLNLDETVKQNDDRGIDFKLPPSAKAN